MTQNLHGSASSGHAPPLAEAPPGYGILTANEHTIQNTVPPGPLPPSQGGVDTPSFGQESSSAILGKKCACIVCLGIGVPLVRNPPGPVLCRLAGCNWEGVWYSISLHEKPHFQQDPINHPSTFFCPIEHCRFSSRRWSDLQRHTTAKHCSNPAKFACSVIGCKYYGEGNGFIRKDKLTDHNKNMHQGQRFHGQAVRAIEPAPAPAYTGASGSSSIGASEE